MLDKLLQKLLIKTQKINRIEQLQNNRIYKNKIFVFGNNKTGTTTLKDFFATLGFRVSNQKDFEALYFGKNNISKESYVNQLYSLVDCWEVFQDLPFADPDCWTDIINEFPSAKYIYTCRDPHEWYRSLISHHSQSAGFDYQICKDQIQFDSVEIAEKLKKWQYNGSCQYDEIYRRYKLQSDDELYDKEKFLNYHIEHQKLAKRALKNVDNLFIDITKDSLVEEKLAVFLMGKKIDLPLLPHSNRRR